MSKREIAGTVAVLIAVAACVAVAMRCADNVRAGMERADCVADELLRSIKADQASDLRGYTAPEFPKPIQPRHWGVEVGDATGRAVVAGEWPTPCR